MTSPRRRGSSRVAALAVLALGNLALAFDPTDRTPRSLDADGFGNELAAIFEDVPLARVRFEDEGLLPPGYAYWERIADADLERPWFSVYVGYFPRQGLLEDEPHDPYVCYRALGWEVLNGPRTLALEHDDVAVAPVVTCLHVARPSPDGDATDERLAIYWQQARGESWASSRDVVADGVARYRDGRSDLAWIRLELDPREDVGPDWIADIDRVMVALARAMR